jgi:hypothetical protein
MDKTRRNEKFRVILGSCVEGEKRENDEQKQPKPTAGSEHVEGVATTVSRDESAPFL